MVGDFDLPKPGSRINLNSGAQTSLAELIPQKFIIPPRSSRLGPRHEKFTASLESARCAAPWRVADPALSARGRTNLSALP